METPINERDMLHAINHFNYLEAVQQTDHYLNNKKKSLNINLYRNLYHTVDLWIPRSNREKTPTVSYAAQSVRFP